MRRFFILSFVFFSFIGCTSTKKDLTPEKEIWTGQYPTGKKYEDVYESHGYDMPREYIDHPINVPRL